MKYIAGGLALIVWALLAAPGAATTVTGALCVGALFLGFWLVAHGLTDSLRPEAPRESAPAPPGPDSQP